MSFSFQDAVSDNLILSKGDTLESLGGVIRVGGVKIEVSLLLLLRARTLFEDFFRRCCRPSVTSAASPRARSRWDLARPRVSSWSDGRARAAAKTGSIHQGARDGNLAFQTSRAVSGAALPPIFPAAEPQRLAEAASSQVSEETQAASSARESF